MEGGFLGVLSTLMIFAGGSSVEGESEVRFGEADDCLAAVWVSATGPMWDGVAEDEADGDSCLTFMRERPRLSLTEKARRIKGTTGRDRSIVPRGPRVRIGDEEQIELRLRTYVGPVLGPILLQSREAVARRISKW